MQLNDWISGYLTYNQDSESPDIFLTWSAIGAISSVLQRKVYLKWSWMTFYPNFYIVLIGPPSARKGTAMGPASNLLRDLQIPLCPESITRAQFIRRLKEATDSVILPNGELALQHSSLSVFSEELTVFIGANNAQLISDLCNLYDCPSEWSYETKGDYVKDVVVAPFVTLVGATTPTLLQAIINLDGIGSGLTARIIMACAPGAARRTIPTFALTPQGQTLYKELLEDLAHLHTLRGEYKMSESYLKLYKPWYLNMSSECPFDAQRFNYYWARRGMHLLKLSIIMNASRDGDFILLDKDFTRALQILEWTEEAMPMAYSSIGRAKEAEVIEPIMGTIASRGKIEYGELLRVFYRDTSDWELQKIVQTLEKIEFIKVVHTGSGIFLEYNKDRKKN